MESHALPLWSIYFITLVYFAYLLPNISVWDLISTLSFCVNSKKEYWTFPKLCYSPVCMDCMKGCRVCSSGACVCWPLVQGALVQPAGVIVRPRWRICCPGIMCLDFKRPCSTAQNIHSSPCCKTLEGTFHFDSAFFGCFFFFFLLC